ncbi:hypothetical protein V7075_07840 [Neobacillus drentensis]|uniref:hypothetical protein n=1 Tax=Neobacillus drentensis TaxID=220684 RepID=UPI003000B55C
MRSRRRRSKKNEELGGGISIGRRNSKKVRQSAMTQRQLDRLLSGKQKSNRRNDMTDWTDRIYQKLKETEADDRAE